LTGSLHRTHADKKKNNDDSRAANAAPASRMFWHVLIPPPLSLGYYFRRISIRRWASISATRKHHRATLQISRTSGEEMRSLPAMHWAASCITELDYTPASTARDSVK
jgi:hypothetical protein